MTVEDPAGPGVEPASRSRGRLRSLAVDTTPLRVSPEFRRLWLAQGVSFLGTQLTAVAVGIQVYDLTGSSAAVGLVGLAALVPLVGLGLVGGALADSVERRRLALCTSGGLAVLSLALVAQAALDLRSVLLLYGIVALQSALFAVDSPVRSTFPPRLLPVELLPAANALSWSATGLAATLGPLLAGLLVAGPGYTAAYAVDVATFVAPLYSLLRLRRMPPQRTEGTGRASVREGLRLLRSRPVLLSTFVADLLAMVFGMPRAVFPELADGTLGGGATTVGLLNAALAVGTLLAALLSGPTGRVRRQGLGVLLAVGAWGAAIVVLGLAPVLWLALLALAVAGAADTVSAVWRQSVLQAATPDEYRGR
ncbi:MAG TPA: MFS transporter, partial [Mycobacteriales bacterium]|nr:MFS transporter [Mycobacteriales bacterium]